MAASQSRILLTGATGYIGGTVLTELVKSNVPFLKDSTITCLVRGGEARISKLREHYGARVQPELFDDLDDTDRLSAVASAHDIVINTTLGFHPTAAVALAEGLARRKLQTGHDVFLIHTSGTSNLADRSHTGRRMEARTFDDDEHGSVYAAERELEAREPYAQRTAELAVIDRARDLGVNVVVIMSPTIYGVGSGAFNRHSIQVPLFVRSALETGQAVVVGDGSGVWDRVHVEDLAELYVLVLRNVVETGGKELKFGNEGIMFSGSGRFAWKELSDGVARTAFELGKIGTAEVRSVSLEEGTRLLFASLPWLTVDIAELSVASNARTESAIAKGLGWKPTRLQEAWERGFREEIEANL